MIVVHVLGWPRVSRSTRSSKASLRRGRSLRRPPSPSKAMPTVHHIRTRCHSEVRGQVHAPAGERRRRSQLATGSAEGFRRRRHRCRCI